jgi:hypothetical protein
VDAAPLPIAKRSVVNWDELLKKAEAQSKALAARTGRKPFKVIRDKDMSDTLLKEMLKKLNLLSYNYKEIVLQTWNQPETTIKEKTFEEDLEDDDTDIKEIESLFINTSNQLVIDNAIDNHFTEIISETNINDTDSDINLPTLQLTKNETNIV